MNLYTEEKKKKKKKTIQAFAPFFGRGDGTSAATIPAFRQTGTTDTRVRPANPGTGGINSPSVPNGANAGMGLVNSASSSVTGIFSSEKLPKSVVLDSDHDPDSDDGEFSYRLQNLPIVFYQVKKGNIVGHLGLDDDYHVKALFVDRDWRRRGVATELYVHAAKTLGVIYSDTPSAMEPESVLVWQNLKKEYPGKISKNKDSVWSFFWKNSQVNESTHLCLVCSNTGKVRNIPCSLCNHNWKTKRFSYKTKESSPKIIYQDPSKFLDVDKGWDLENG